jgi:hypothetical protein
MTNCVSKPRKLYLLTLTWLSFTSHTSSTTWLTPARNPNSLPQDPRLTSTTLLPTQPLSSTPTIHCHQTPSVPPPPAAGTNTHCSEENTCAYHTIHSVPIITPHYPPSPTFHRSPAAVYIAKPAHTTYKRPYTAIPPMPSTTLNKTPTMPYRLPLPPSSMTPQSLWQYRMHYPTTTTKKPLTATPQSYVSRPTNCSTRAPDKY